MVQEFEQEVVENNAVLDISSSNTDIYHTYNADATGSAHTINNNLLISDPASDKENYINTKEVDVPELEPSEIINVDT